MTLKAESHNAIKATKNIGLDIKTDKNLIDHYGTWMRQSDRIKKIQEIKRD